MLNNNFSYTQLTFLFFFRKICITFTMILTLFPFSLQKDFDICLNPFFAFFFFFFRKVLISFTYFFSKLFFAFLIIVSCYFYIERKKKLKIFCYMLSNSLTIQVFFYFLHQDFLRQNFLHQNSLHQNFL